MVFVAQIDVATLNADHLRGNQQTLQKTVRVALQVGAVLEGSGFAFVNVHRHQPGSSVIADDAPFAPRWKTRPAQTAQTGVLHSLQNGLGIALTAGDGGHQRVTPIGAVSFVVGHCRAGRLGCGTCTWNTALNKISSYEISSCLRRYLPGKAAIQGCNNGVRSGKRHRTLVHDGSRGLLATSNARRRNDTHIFFTQQLRQSGDQGLRTSQLAGQAVTHSHRDAGRFCIAPEHFEVVVKSCHFVDLRHGNVHLPGQRHQMPVVQATVCVVELMQILNQQVTAVACRRLRAEQIAYLGQRDVIGLASLELAL